MPLRTNIPAIYADRFLASFWVIAPILVPYYEFNGLNADQVFLIQAVFSAAMLFLEVPTGYLADVIGRRSALILSGLLFPAGVAVYTLSHGFYGFAMAEIVVAMAISLRSGTDSALLYDTLLALDREPEHKRIAGTSSFLERLGGAVASIMGGLLAQISIRLPFYVNIATSSLLLPIALFFREPPRKRFSPDHPHLQEIWKVLRQCSQHAEIRQLILLSALVSGINIVGFWAYLLYYGKLGLTPVMFGILFAAYGLCSAVGSKVAHTIEDKIGRNAALWASLLSVPVFIMLACIQSVWLIPLIMFNGFLLGFSSPLLTHYLNRVTDSSIRATTLSVSSMVGRLINSITAIATGVLAADYGLSSSFLLLALIFALGGATILLVLKPREVGKAG